MLVGKPAPDFRMNTTKDPNTSSTRRPSPTTGQLARPVLLPGRLHVRLPDRGAGVQRRRRPPSPRHDAELLGVSTDGVLSHVAWMEFHIGQLDFPLASDRTHAVSQAYDVLDDAGQSARGVFIIDPRGDRPLRGRPRRPGRPLGRRDPAGDRPPCRPRSHVRAVRLTPAPRCAWSRPRPERPVTDQIARKGPSHMSNDRRCTPPPAARCARSTRPCSPRRALGTRRRTPRSNPACSTSSPKKGIRMVPTLFVGEKFVAGFRPTRPSELLRS